MLPVMIVCLEAVFALFSNNSFPKKIMCVCVWMKLLYTCFQEFSEPMYVHVRTSYGYIDG
jgi:hypothetical protein